MRKSDLRSKTPLTPLHPALGDRSFTIQQVRDLSIIAGIPSQVLAGILTGRMRPDEMVCERLLLVLDDHIVTALREDYDPMRDMEIKSHPPRSHEVVSRYPVRYLKAGDLLFTTDDQWVMLSSTEISGQRIRLYSGQALCTTTSIRNHVIASVAPRERIDDPRHRSEDQRWRKVLRDQMSEESTDIESVHRMDMIEDMLRRIREEKSP